jgi:hypothetical protein
MAPLRHADGISEYRRTPEVSKPTVKMTRLTLADILVGKRCSDPTFS